MGVRVIHTHRSRSGKIFRTSRTYDSYSDYLFVKLLIFPFRAVWWLVTLPFRILGFLLKTIFRRK
nr:MAG TPA: hypothetical protein [Caudoviricetes sp.]